jgi:protein SCO1/2
VLAGDDRPLPYPDDVRRPPTLLLALATAIVVALAIALIVGRRSSGGSSSSPSSAPAHGTGASGFDGAPLPGDVQAPGFTLIDQRGRRVSLADYRGRVVVLTFLYSRCGASCILIAQQIRGALEELRRPPAVLIVSADPATDTRASVARFLEEVSLSGRVEYLTGPLSSLREVWRAYGVTPASISRTTFDRFASILLLDAQGRERVLFQSEVLTPESLSHDIGRLDGEPTHP